MQSIVSINNVEEDLSEIIMSNEPFFLSHREIQRLIKKELENKGYIAEIETEVRLSDTKNGYIDITAKKGDFTLGIEIDHSVPRYKSVQKLNLLNPNLAIFILKTRYFSRGNIEKRTSVCKKPFMIINLLNKSVSLND